MKNLVSLVVGMLFAFGLGISGMTNPKSVRGFLDIFGDWNPNLMGVMIGAIGVHAISYFLIKKRQTPILDVRFYVPEKRNIDKKLLIGSAIFGLGWGWAGICPAPSLVDFSLGNNHVLFFILSMLLGMFVFHKTKKYLQ